MGMDEPLFQVREERWRLLRRAARPFRRFLAWFSLVDDERARRMETTEAFARDLADLRAALPRLESQLRRMRRSDELAIRLFSDLRSPEAARPADPVLNEILSKAIAPEGSALFVELAYATLLGRPVPEEQLGDSCRALVEGTMSRGELLLSIVDSGEFRENALIERLCEEALDAVRPFSLEREPHWPSTTERVVEIPWVLSRCRTAARLLDVGYTYAIGPYLTSLLGLPARVHGLDAARRHVTGLIGVCGDARDAPYRSGSFDTVVCISTLEHLGRDNARYGLALTQDPTGDRRALLEMHRILIPGGHALVTVPMGRHEDHGWFLQYDAASWAALVGSTPFTIHEEEAFRLTDEGWVRTEEPRALHGLSYGDGAPGARGLVCAVLRKPD